MTKQPKIPIEIILKDDKYVFKKAQILTTVYSDFSSVFRSGLDLTHDNTVYHFDSNDLDIDLIKYNSNLFTHYRQQRNTFSIELFLNLKYTVNNEVYTRKTKTQDEKRIMKNLRNDRREFMKNPSCYILVDGKFPLHKTPIPKYKTLSIIQGWFMH